MHLIFFLTRLRLLFYSSICRVKQRRALVETNPLRDNPAGLIVRMTGRGRSTPAPALKYHPSIDPLCLENSRPKGGNKGVSMAIILT